MFTFLQIIISVIVIYLVFSVIVYVIVEAISNALQLRGRTLRRAVLHFFNDGELRLGERIYAHPLVDRLRRKDDKLTAYIPSRNVAAAIIDIVGEGGEIRGAYEQFLSRVKALPEGSTKRLLASLAQQSTNLETLTASLEKWFNESMDRVTGWYKKRIRWVVLVVSMAVTVGFNVDTVYILQALRADPVLRQRINDLGDQLITDSSFHRMVSSLPVPDAEYFEDYVNDSSVQAVAGYPAEQADSLAHAQLALRYQQWQHMSALVLDADLPVGWLIHRKNSWWMVVGWAITALALTAGAPFWFDLLKRLVNLRGTGPKPNSPASATSSSPASS